MLSRASARHETASHERFLILNIALTSAWIDSWSSRTSIFGVCAALMRAPPSRIPRGLQGRGGAGQNAARSGRAGQHSDERLHVHDQCNRPISQYRGASEALHFPVMPAQALD